MSIEKLASQLRRDLTANPKKAAALGLMILVALYFWGPLAWKFVKSGSTKQHKLNVSSLILTDDPVEPSKQQGKAGGRTRFRWEKVRQLIENDPHMQSADFEVAWVDPFGGPAPAPAEVEQVAQQSMEEPATVAAAVATIDPQNIGLTVGGIMLSSARRLAIVNGQICREGDLVSVIDKRDKTTTYEFRVQKIHKHSIQLEIAGQIFTLELSQPRLAHGDDFGRGRPKEEN